MAFPTSPTNGQQANINGITYTYSNTVTAWTVSTSVSNSFVSINVSDNVNSGNVLATGVISATGNVSGGNLVVTGNIVDTGALTIITGSNGNITLSPNGTGIVTTTGAISTTGNISANNATFTSNQTLSYGTANGVAYLNGSKVLTTGSALVFDGTSLGVGVTPSVQYSGIKSLQVGSTTNLFDNGASTKFYHNAYTAASGDETYLTTGYAQGYLMASNGQHQWYTAASGTAGNTFSFTQAMTLDASGNLIVGATATRGTYKLDIRSDTSIALGSNATYYGTIGYSAGTGLLSLAAESGGGINFLSGATERVRIDTSGNLLVGATTNDFGGRLEIVATGNMPGGGVKNDNSAQPTLGVWNAATTGDNVFTRFLTEAVGTARGTISYNRAGGLVAYNTTSDYRAKDIVGSVTDSGALIDSVPVYMGTMKGATQERPMFIAHEVPAYAHTGEKDAVDKDGSPVYQQMDASALIPVMWAEIQSLRKRLAALESA